ncbi:MAG: MotA/TolQ/ExbB proton channel family protein [Hyphomicrobium sp.]
MEPHNFSILGMIMAADPVVKAVMLMLALSSVACWAIVFEKAVRLRRLNADVAQLEEVAAGKASPDQANGLTATVLDAANREADDGAARGESRGEVRGRLERAMRGALKSELQSAEKGLPFLATTGSAAPFIGLFGTVWGIMNSFASIAQKQDTSLATVAPGIAEALFATALGLAAAIPAVLAYNHYSVRLGRVAARGNAASIEIAKAFSRPPAEAKETRGTVEPLRAGKGH